MTWELAGLLVAPFVICLVLSLIHCYLGLHVVSRGVIFVDLALAQMAAVGVALALLAGYEPVSIEARIAALVFTTLGALLFSLGRFRDEAIPQEAVIGIVYAVGSAVALLVLDKAPHGVEELHDILEGTVLYVTWTKILETVVIYSVVGAVHFLCRKRFITISTNLDEAKRQGWSLRFWDFLFYALFGVVVTSSVQIAGILLVFSYLVVPASCAMLFSASIPVRLLIGWAIGVAVSLVGLVISAVWDFSTGTTIVATFGVAMLLAVLIRFCFRAYSAQVGA